MIGSNTVLHIETLNYQYIQYIHLPPPHYKTIIVPTYV